MTRGGAIVCVFIFSYYVIVFFLVMTRRGVKGSLYGYLMTIVTYEGVVFLFVKDGGLVMAT